mgnify:FL=1
MGYQKLDSTIKERVWNALQKLPEGQYIKLKGNHTPPIYRIRVGKYRILFEMTEHIIRIIDVDSRGDIYKQI